MNGEGKGRCRGSERAIHELPLRSCSSSFTVVKSADEGSEVAELPGEGPEAVEQGSAESSFLETLRSFSFFESTSRGV